MRKIKNILVTGGAGFIGSCFIRYVLSLPEFSGYIINYDLLTYAANLNNLSSVETDSRYYFIKGDICNQQQLLEVCRSYNVDTIINFAAETHVDNSITGPNSFINTNIVGVFYLLEIVRQYPHIHLHQVSTDEVYGSLGDEGWFDEQSAHRPNSPYSASKASSDHLVRAYFQTYDLSLTLSHCCNNYGPEQHEEKFIPLMITNCIEDKSLPIYGEGKNIREWIYVVDHVDALWKILTLGKKGQIYDVGSGEEKRNVEVLEIIINVLADKLNVPKDRFADLITNVTDRPGHDYRYAINSEKIKKELGWSCQHTFLEGLDKTVDKYLDALLAHQKNIINPVI